MISLTSYYHTFYLHVFFFSYFSNCFDCSSHISIIRGIIFHIWVSTLSSHFCCFCFYFFSSHVRICILPVTNSLTPRSRVVFEKPTVVWLIEKFLSFWTHRFITMFIEVYHCTLSWPSLIHFACSHPISSRFILILLPCQYPAFPNSHFPSDILPEVCHNKFYLGNFTHVFLYISFYKCV
jgi:hypothetical protein